MSLIATKEPFFVELVNKFSLGIGEDIGFGQGKLSGSTTKHIFDGDLSVGGDMNIGKVFDNSLDVYGSEFRKARYR